MFLHISSRQNWSANGTSSCFTWHTFHIIKAPLGRIWRNFRLRMHIAYFRTRDYRHFRSCAMIRSPARSTANATLSVPIYYLHISSRQNSSANGTSSCFTWHSWCIKLFYMTHLVHQVVLHDTLGTSSCFTWHTFHIINQIAKRQGGEILSHIWLCPHNKIKCHILLIPPPNWGTFQYMAYCVLSLKNNIN